MRRNVTIGCSVYADSDGGVAFLDTPEGVIPPPFIAHMTYLGPPCDVVTMAVNRFRTQQELAVLLGTRQQYISRWINAEMSPVLSDEQWAVLVRLAIAPLSR